MCLQPTYCLVTQKNAYLYYKNVIHRLRVSQNKCTFLWVREITGACGRLSEATPFKHFKSNHLHMFTDCDTGSEKRLSTQTRRENGNITVRVNSNTTKTSYILTGKHLVTPQTRHVLESLMYFTTDLRSLECITQLSPDQYFPTLDRHSGLLITLSTTGELNRSTDGRIPHAFRRNCALSSKTRRGRKREASKNRNQKLFFSTRIFGLVVFIHFILGSWRNNASRFQAASIRQVFLKNTNQRSTRCSMARTQL